MFHRQFEHRNAANSIENERFELKNAADTDEIAPSSSKMLQNRKENGQKRKYKNTEKP